MPSSGRPAGAGAPGAGWRAALLPLALHLLILLSAAGATSPRRWSYSLAPRANEGFWHAMPLAATDHRNVTAAATRFWRPTGRHPTNTFHAVAGLTLDRFTVALWVKVEPQHFRQFSAGVFWELACANCGENQATWSQPELRREQQQQLEAAALADDCPINVRLEATPQQAVVRTVLPEHQALSVCAPVPQQIQIVNGARKIADGRWHHVAVVFDTTAAQRAPTAHQRNQPAQVGTMSLHQQGVLGTDYRLELWVDGHLDGQAEGPQNLKLLSGRRASELTVGRSRVDHAGNTLASPAGQAKRVTARTSASAVNEFGFMRATMTALEVREEALSAAAIAALAQVPCEMSAWSAWSACTLTAGSSGAAMTRTRSVARYPLNGGTPCSSVLSQTEACESQFVGAGDL